MTPLTKTDQETREQTKTKGVWTGDKATYVFGSDIVIYTPQ